MSQQSQTARRRSLWGRTLRRVVLPLNILAIVGMILIGYTDHIDPRQHFLLPSLSLAMPSGDGCQRRFPHLLAPEQVKVRGEFQSSDSSCGDPCAAIVP